MHALRAVGRACMEGEGPVHSRREKGLCVAKELAGLYIRACMEGGGTSMKGGWWVVHARREKGPCIPGGQWAVNSRRAEVLCLAEGPVG